jgi:hypothetical protein
LIPIKAPSRWSVTNPEYHGRSKHIGIRHHFIRQELEAGTVTLVYIPTAQQAADGLTKPLGKIAFERFVKQLGMASAPTSPGLVSA